MVGCVNSRVDTFFKRSHSRWLPPKMAKIMTSATPTPGISTTLSWTRNLIHNAVHWYRKIGGRERERVESEKREEGVNHLWEWDFSIRVKKNSSSDSSSLFLSAFLSLGPHFCLSSTEVTYFDTGLIVQLFLSLRDSRNLILFLNHKMLFESHLQGWGKVPHLKN